MKTRRQQVLDFIELHIDPYYDRRPTIWLYGRKNWYYSGFLHMKEVGSDVFRNVHELTWETFQGLLLEHRRGVLELNGTVFIIAQEFKNALFGEGLDRLAEAGYEVFHITALIDGTD